MAICFSGSLLRANFNIVFSCFILLLFVANKFLFFFFSTVKNHRTEFLHSYIEDFPK